MSSLMVAEVFVVVPSLNVVQLVPLVEYSMM